MEAGGDCVCELTSYGDFDSDIFSSCMRRRLTIETDFRLRKEYLKIRCELNVYSSGVGRGIKTHAMDPRGFDSIGALESTHGSGIGFVGHSCESR